jgi:hypothetical protein
MRCRCVVLLLLALAAGLAQAEPPATNEHELNALYRDGLLAPRGEGQASSETLLARLKQLAQAGDGNAADEAYAAQAAYLLGALYAQGKRHPAQRVERSALLARHWYLTALRRGHTGALAKLAELEIVEGNDAMAMGWAQVNARFQTQAEPGRQHPYAAELIMRLFARRPGLTADQATADTNALLAQHRETIDAGIERWKVQRKANQDASAQLVQRGNYLRGPREGADTIEKTATSLVEFAIEVNRKGRVSRAWLIDAVPDYTLGERLQSRLSDMRFNTSAAESRFAVVPIVYTGQRFSLAVAAEPGSPPAGPSNGAH